MPKFHINKAGVVKPCRATTKPCPLGGHHFSTAEDAQGALDMKNELLAQLGMKPATVETAKAAKPERPKSTTAPSVTTVEKQAANNLKEVKEAWEGVKDEDPATGNELSALSRKIPYFSLSSSPAAYHEREAKMKILRDRWKKNLFAAKSPFTDEKINEKIYEWAYADGHSSGYGDVTYKFEEYADLTSTVYDAYAQDVDDYRNNSQPFPDDGYLSPDDYRKASEAQGRFPHYGTLEEKVAFSAKETSLRNGFINDLVHENGPVPAAAASKIYDAAYEDGHPAGYWAVASEYAEKYGRLTEVFKVAPPANYEE